MTTTFSGKQVLEKIETARYMAESIFQIKIPISLDQTKLQRIQEPLGEYSWYKDIIKIYVTRLQCIAKKNNLNIDKLLIYTICQLAS